MNPAKERKAIDAALDSYRAQLDTIPDELFAETPKSGSGWCYAEVYSHILQATLSSSIALERCISNNCKPTTKGLNVFGRLAMVLGQYPVKIQMPAEIAARIPVVKISKEEARNLIVRCRKRVDELAPLLKNAPVTARHKHPLFGMLNAQQWFKFIRIHLQHHLKQLDRIRKKIAKN